MPTAEHPLEDWLTGLPGRPAASFNGVRATGERTVVVENADLVPHLADLLDDSSWLLVRRTGGDVAGVSPGQGGSYDGSFVSRDSNLLFDNGYRLAARQYGAAEFLGHDSLTVLRVTDADDFSAFLRDADNAWMTGSFADHVTHPNVMIADLAGLGGSYAQAGPLQRLFVFDDGRVSTSPTGAVLGTVSDDLAGIAEQWRISNLASTFPDAVCLNRVIGDIDRSAALLERPWVGRYVAAIGLLRSIRSDHRVPTQVSGFAGRITEGLPSAGVADLVDNAGAPVLVRVGRAVLAHDPISGFGTPLSGTGVAIVESLLVHSDREDAAAWCRDALGIAGEQVAAHVLDTLELLTAAGVAARWSQQVRVGWADGGSGGRFALAGSTSARATSPPATSAAVQVGGASGGPPASDAAEEMRFP